MQVQLADFTMAYEDAGEGLPVLFIHGYPLNRSLWDPQVGGLIGSFRVIAPDLRGHGESQAMPGPYTMDLLADDCAALLDALDLDRPVVVCGLSMGGYASFAFYRKYPRRVAGLILASTRAGPDNPEGKAARDSAAQKARAEGVAAVAAGMLPKLLAPNTYRQRPALVEMVDAMLKSISLEGMLGDLMGMKDRPDSTPLLAGIGVPTLVIAGADDQIIPPAEAEGMHAAIPNSRLEILPEAGHLLNLEQPDRFNQAVRNFLNEL